MSETSKEESSRQQAEIPLERLFCGHITEYPSCLVNPWRAGFDGELGA